VNATTKARTSEATDRELALQLGSLMLACFGGRGGSEVVRVIDESGLSFIQMKTVVRLGGFESEGSATTVTELAEILGVSVASASRAVDGLVKGKLVARVEDPEDRRVRRLTLTPSGRELSDHIVSARLAGIEDFTASLEGAERTKLAAALAALMEREELAALYRRNAERAGR
jgi:DNA-binding MarR family transcriptional regulator